jgi:hypothetical protein
MAKEALVPADEFGPGLPDVVAAPGAGIELYILRLFLFFGSGNDAAFVARDSPGENAKHNAHDDARRIRRSEKRQITMRVFTTNASSPRPTAYGRSDGGAVGLGRQGV